jgi:hypothetical protein
MAWKLLEDSMLGGGIRVTLFSVFQDLPQILPNIYPMLEDRCFVKVSCGLRQENDSSPLFHLDLCVLCQNSVSIVPLEIICSTEEVFAKSFGSRVQKGLPRAEHCCLQFLVMGEQVLKVLPELWLFSLGHLESLSCY